MENTNHGAPVLSTLVEFFGIALGPLHQVVLYELDSQYNGRTVQVELNMLTHAEIGDPMPKDIVHLLERKKFKSTDYVTGLTALYGKNQIANLSILYLHNMPPQKKNYLLMLMADSTDYYNIAARMLQMSNLNEKMSYPSFAEAVSPENIIHVDTILRAKEAANESAGVQDVAIAKIEAIIREVMGKNAGEQPAFSQEKRMEIVQLLYNEGIFKIKGMVRQVAMRVSCSDATIYRYLSYIEK